MFAEKTYDRLGPIVCPSPTGGGTADLAQPVDATARTAGPFLVGTYSIVSDVDAYVIQGAATPIGALAAADITARGVIVPANTEVTLRVDGLDRYLAWVAVSTSGTNLRINDRNHGVRS